MPSRPLESFRDHPVHHKHLDLNTVQELPDSYAWTPIDQHEKVPEAVPVIDLSDPNAIQLIGDACKNWGVFQVISHGVSTSLLRNVEKVTTSLFSLPMQQKLKAARSPNGVSGYGVARISSFFPKRMWSEGFTVMGSPLHHARLLWPNDYTHFCDVLDEYEKQVNKLASRLMWLALGPLGITKDDINWAGPKGDFKDACDAIQLNSYPVCPDPNRAMGLAAHTDSTLLTILYQNNTSGLQVRREGTGWLTVPPLPGTLVVNVGDMLHILSNGLYPSVLHRAVVNRTQHRISIACLYGPPERVKISPVSKLVDQGQYPLYRPITWSEYLATKAKHFDKALSFVRFCVPPLPLINGKNDHNNSIQVG